METEKIFNRWRVLSGATLVFLVGSGIFFYYNPNTIPWQGDVTNIANRPSDSYVNNYQEVEFAPPSGYQGNPNDIRSWMRVSGYAYQKRITMGGLSHTSIGKFYFELGKTAMDMVLSAQGTGRAYEEVDDNTEYYLVPFKGETKAAKDNYDFKIIYANHFLNNPLGIKFRYIKKSAKFYWWIILRRYLNSFR